MGMSPDEDIPGVLGIANAPGHGLASGDLIKIAGKIYVVEVISMNAFLIVRPKWWLRLLLWLRIRRPRWASGQPHVS
jgi:hypothetical protein